MILASVVNEIATWVSIIGIPLTLIFTAGIFLIGTWWYQRRIEERKQRRRISRTQAVEWKTHRKKKWWQK